MEGALVIRKLWKPVLEPGPQLRALAVCRYQGTLHGTLWSFFNAFFE